nr:molecular chaperone [uncultured Pseudomonas sp.]
MDKQRHHLQLRVPTLDKRSLSFCDATPRGLKLWIGKLPKANIGETARQLYQALIELNQLLTPSDIRLQMLELLRPEVYFVCQQLERHFLNQAIVLDERPRKVANLCQALQNHLAVGYKLIVVHLAPQQNLDRNQLLATALQRAVYSLCGPLVRATQLYCPVPEGLWLELHQLYQIALERDLQRRVIRDPQARHVDDLSIEQSYLAALMLGCARCNQMRQAAIARLAEALEPWSAQVRLQAGNAPSSLFAVALTVDGPPRYISLLQGGELPGSLGIDPTPLVDALKAYLQLPAEQRSQSSLLVPEGLSTDMLQHLCAAWGDISERSFQRNQGQGSLNLCIGMSALHFFLANKRPFNEVLKRPNELGAAVFEAPSGTPDIWAKAFDAPKTRDWAHHLPMENIEYQRSGADNVDSGAAPAEGYPTFTLPIVNHSPGGYCMSWPKEVPSQLQAGEIIGLQDSPEHAWSVAVVRWIRQVRGGGTQMGIELVAPHAEPCGLQLVRKTESNSQYLRALLVPGISAISRPATLITPRLPFQEGNKVLVNRNGNERPALLSRRQTSTGSFNQFEYRELEQPPDDHGKPVTAQKSRGPDGEEDFDSLWKSL